MSLSLEEVKLTSGDFGDGRTWQAEVEHETDDASYHAKVQGVKAWGRTQIEALRHLNLAIY